MWHIIIVAAVLALLSNIVPLVGYAFQSPIPTPTAMIGTGPPLTILPTPTNAPTWTPTADNRSDEVPFNSPIETPTPKVVTPIAAEWPTPTPEVEYCFALGMWGHIICIGGW